MLIQWICVDRYMTNRKSWTLSPNTTGFVFKDDCGKRSANGELSIFHGPLICSTSRKHDTGKNTSALCPNTHYILRNWVPINTRIWPKVLQPRLALWRFPPHLRCPFCFLFLAGVLIGWLAVPFSRGTETGAAGGEVGEKRSGSLSILDLKGPAGENLRGLKEIDKEKDWEVIRNIRRLGRKKNNKTRITTLWRRTNTRW